VKVDSPSTRANVPGVFATCDLVGHTNRQAITVFDTDCAAALDADWSIASFVELGTRVPPAGGVGRETRSGNAAHAVMMGPPRNATSQDQVCAP
jgi:hypothetical protein